jgi:hypothetical protein
MKCRWLLALVLFALPAARAGATVLAPIDTRGLTERADRVVLGTVESVVARWSSDHQAIYTEVTVRVARSYKGAVKPGDAMVVRREGGAVDGIGMRVFGAASFEVGEEVLLFVETRGAASWTVGMTQGKLHVTTASDGSKQVAADLSGVTFLRNSSGAPAQPTSGQPRRLEDLEREIRSYVRTR